MEITNNAIQTVAVNNNVLFTETPVPGCASIIHRDGSGLVTLRGLTNQCRARFRVTFSGDLKADVGAPVSGTTLLSLGIVQSGEILPATTMTISVADTTATYNVATETLIDVPAGCCTTISVKNITPAIGVQVSSANLIVERVA